MIEVGDSNLIYLSSTLFAPIGVNVILGFFVDFNFYSFLGDAVSFVMCIFIVPFIVRDFLMAKEPGELPLPYKAGF